MKILLTTIGLLGVLYLTAQPKGEIGLTIGGTAYLGDLESEDQLPPTDRSELGFALSASKYIGYTTQIRGQFQYASILGDDQNAENIQLRQRGFSFTNSLLAFDARFLWEPFAKRRFPEQGGYRNILSPYVFGGVGVAISDPSTNYGPNGGDGFSDRVKQDIAAEKSPAVFIPVGGGLRLDLSKKTSIGLELTVNRAFSDQLDGVSNAGEPDTDDWWVMAGLTFAYRWNVPDYDRDGFLDSLDRCPQLAGVDYAGGCPDSDGDMVPDAIDKCPYQAGKPTVQGCPDSDFDLVADLTDRCPDYPGHPSGRGCPDQDGDTIIDDMDMCPNCPGVPALSGCPDADGDGIADGRDRCPNLAGSIDTHGCPYSDSDQDGTPDEKDECPNVAGPTKLDGCPDSDGDGLVDRLDKCPDLVGELTNEGCPVVTEELKEKLALFTEAVQFETASNTLKEASEETLNELVELLSEYNYYHLKIEGHTDSQGKASSNLKLSQLRAQACHEYLVGKGVSAERLQHAGFGEEQPIASNSTADGRRKNRRVNFELFVP